MRRATVPDAVRGEILPIYTPGGDYRAKRVLDKGFFDAPARADEKRAVVGTAGSPQALRAIAVKVFRKKRGRDLGKGHEPVLAPFAPAHHEDPLRHVHVRDVQVHHLARPQPRRIHELEDRPHEEAVALIRPGRVEKDRYLIAGEDFLPAFGFPAEGDVLQRTGQNEFVSKEKKKEK